MKKFIAGVLSLVLALAAAGCGGDATDDATVGEPAVPEVDVGEEDVDLNPATDDDVDIDTPAPGDE